MLRSNRETISGRIRKTVTPSNSGTVCRIVTRSKSRLSQSSSSKLKTSDENEGINPFGKEMDLYEDEYSLFLLRVLQSKMIQREERERGEETKKSLVSLKKEYEELLQEHNTLYHLVQKMKTHGECLEMLKEQSSKTQKLLDVLAETEFREVLQKIGQVLEAKINKLQLIGVKREDIEDAFSKNLLGFESGVYKLLKSMEEYATKCGTHLPEIVEKVNEIRSLHAENEKLKERCTIHANQLRKKSISSDYEKYLKMATEECEDIMDTSSNEKTEEGKSSFADETQLQTTADWGKVPPASSSTPTISAEKSTEKIDAGNSNSEMMLSSNGDIPGTIFTCSNVEGADDKEL